MGEKLADKLRGLSLVLQYMGKYEEARAVEWLATQCGVWEVEVGDILNHKVALLKTGPDTEEEERSTPVTD